MRFRLAPLSPHTKGVWLHAEEVAADFHAEDNGKIGDINGYK